MRRVYSITMLLAVTLCASSFTVTKQDLLGSWRWLYMVHAQSGHKVDISQLTMKMAKEVKIQFKDDNTYAEITTRSEDKHVSSNAGEWAIDKEGTILTMTMNGKSMPSKIVGLKSDTLTVEMYGPMNLVMVKEK